MRQSGTFWIKSDHLEASKISEIGKNDNIGVLTKSQNISNIDFEPQSKIEEENINQNVPRDHNQQREFEIKQLEKKKP